MKRIVSIIVAFMLIGCSEAETKSGKNITNKVIKSSVVEPVETFKYTHVDPVEMYLDDMTFTEAFGVEYRAKGEGHTFWWKGNEYTTDLLTHKNENPSVDEE